MAMLFINLLAILLGVTVLIILAYKGIQMYITALIAALVVIILSPGIGFFAGVTEFCTGTGGFVSGYLVYMFLAVALGNIMNATGTATKIGQSIANVGGGKFATLSVVLIGAALTTCGISGYVAAFASFPIVLQVCKRARIPRELIPGILASSQILGQGILPYNTLTNNLIPAEILGTSIAGAPLVRMCGFFFCITFITIYFSWQKKKISAKMTPEEIDDQFHLYDDEQFSKDLPSLFNSVFPVACGIAFLVYMTNTSTLRPLYTVYVTLTIGMTLTVLMNYKRLGGKNPLKILEQSFVTSVSSTVVCGIVIGFGAVVALSPFFTDAVAWFQSINFSPYFQTVIVTSIFAAIMASTPGAVRMSCNIFGKYWAGIPGINMNAMHAITTCSGLGLNTMPHNGSVIMCNERSRLPLKGTFRHTIATGGFIIMFGSLFQAIIATMLYPLG